MSCKGTLRQVFYLSEALSPSGSYMYDPRLVYMCNFVYTVYLFTQGGGGANQIEG
jgi:hypothetical protein